MKMVMSEGDIIQDYRQAKNKREQVGILADQNLVSKAEMAAWLEEHGECVDRRLLNKLPHMVRSSQADKADSGKLRLTLVPRKILWGIAATREYGLIKYPETGVDGWRNIGVERLRDALMRHMMAYLDDPRGVDEESGLPHLFHLCFNAAALCEVEDLPLPTKELIDEWKRIYQGKEKQ